MRPVDINRYNRAAGDIDGWFSEDAARLFGWVDEIQKAHKISGNLFEIGCHHGKSAQLLGMMAQPQVESVLVCDLFGNQADNVSGSGNGDREIFEHNMKPLDNRSVSYRVFQKNSLHLTPADIGTNYRFFHIDGGHNPDEALADLQLAAACLSDKGIIALDDPFRSEWPGVTEALIRFIDANPDFEALIVGCNKILLTRKSASALYLKEFESHSAQNAIGFGYPWKIKSLPFLGANLRILFVPDYREHLTPGNLLRRIYHSPWLSKFRTSKGSYTPVTTKVNSGGGVA
jgi:hypothetical protein